MYPLERLGGHDPQSLRSRPDALSQMRRDDEGRGLHHGSPSRGPNHPSPQVDVRGREAASASGRLSGSFYGRRAETSTKYFS